MRTVSPPIQVGTTQPLDLTVFSSFKYFLGSGLRRLADPRRSNFYHVFDLCSILSFASKTAFIGPTIRSGFRWSGIWPVNPKKLLGQSRPLSATECTRLATVPDMMAMLEKKREAPSGQFGHWLFGASFWIHRKGFA